MVRTWSVARPGPSSGWLAARYGAGRRPGGRSRPHPGRHGVGAPDRHRRGVRPAQRGGDAALRDPHRIGGGRSAHGRGRSPRLARHDRRHAVDWRRGPGRPGRRPDRVRAGGRHGRRRAVARRRPDRGTLVLADRAGGAPTVVDLGPGPRRPGAAGDVVAVLDQDSGRLRTFDRDGALRGTADFAPGAVAPVRGEMVARTSTTRRAPPRPSSTPTGRRRPSPPADRCLGPSPGGPVLAAGPAAAPATVPLDGPGVALPKAPTDVAVSARATRSRWRGGPGRRRRPLHRRAQPRGRDDHHRHVGDVAQSAGQPGRVAVSATNAAGSCPLLVVATASAAVARPGRRSRSCSRRRTVRGRTRSRRPGRRRPRPRSPGARPGELDLRAGCDGHRTTTPTSLAAVAGDPAPPRTRCRCGRDPRAGLAAAHRPPDHLHRHRATRHLRRADDTRRGARRRRRDHRGRERRRRATGPCALSVDDEIRWSGTCGDRTRTRIAVGGLDPSTTYTAWC